jgi:hypothetical protein
MFIIKKLVSTASLGLKYGTHIRPGMSVMRGRGSRKTADVKLTLSILLCQICEFHKKFILSNYEYIPIIKKKLHK